MNENTKVSKVLRPPRLKPVGKKNLLEEMAPCLPGFGEAMSPVFQGNVRGRALQAMDRLAGLASIICGADHANVYLTQDGISRLVASNKSMVPYRSYQWVFSDAPYGVHDQILIEDARTNTKIQALPCIAAHNMIAGFFMRMPVISTANLALGLLIFSKTPHQGPSKGDMRLLNEIVHMIREEFESIERGMTGRWSDGSIAPTLAEIIAEVTISSEPKMLLDAKLKVKAVSQPAADLLGQTTAALLRSTHYQYAPSATDALAFYHRKALKSRVSTPDMEVNIATSGQPGVDRVFSVVASPVTPSDSKAVFLYKTMTELTGVVGRQDKLENNLAGQGAQLDPLIEPSADFLFDTLIPRRAIRARNGLNYVSLRSWRQPIREFQINALKALKLNSSSSFADRIGAEMAAEIKSLIGVSGFSAVVPVPCGHSKGNKCLSVDIARAVGKHLELPVVQAFARTKLMGSSHPRQNINRPPLILRIPVDGSVLLVDDVATSGDHLAEAATMLRQHCTTVLSVAWIGGDAMDGPSEGL